MSHSVALTQIEQATRQLSYEERLWLIKRLANGLRHCAADIEPALEATLADMAADPDVRRELAQIAREFENTEMDGLEGR
jgi:hypothetical protein